MAKRITSIDVGRYGHRCCWADLVGEDDASVDDEAVAIGVDISWILVERRGVTEAIYHSVL